MSKARVAPARVGGWARHQVRGAGSGPFSEQVIEPACESRGEHSIDLQVARADGRAHPPRLLPRREPGMDLGACRLSFGERPVFRRDALDVAPGQRPYRIRRRGTISATKSSSSPPDSLLGHSQMPTRGSLSTIVPSGAGSPISMLGCAFRSRSVTALQRAVKSSFASAMMPTTSRSGAFSSGPIASRRREKPSLSRTANGGSDAKRFR